MQKRIVAGDASGSGSPFPQLYDLDRVEVLKGPQGTLYGESSEGGAVRFITPAPNLTTYSGSARAELSGAVDGGLNHEEGVALGGPIIRDKVGFRFSLWQRDDSGYVDHVYAFTGQTLGTNTNTENRYLARLAVTWRPTANLTITPAFYISRDHFGDSDAFTENVAAFTAPAKAGLGAHTYGPYNFYGPYKTALNCNIGLNYVGVISPCFIRQPRTVKLSVSSLSLDYNFPAFNVHSATGYVTDISEGLANAAFGDVSSFYGGVPFLYNYPQYYGNLQYKDKRNTTTEELRLTSNPSQSPLSYVGGAFYSNQDTHQNSQDFADLDGVIQDIFGTSTTVILKAPSGVNGGISQRFQKVEETEYAGFGELTYAATSSLSGIAGLRVARDTISYSGYLSGPFFGYSAPTAANGGLSSGTQKTTAVLPKFTLQYRFDPTQMVYATASKGERVGGVNAGAYQTKCASTLSSLGLSGTPMTYNPDTLWDYELGAKVRAFGGRAQINASAFYVDWTNVQVTYSLPSPCGFSFVSNAGSAISRGGDLQAQYSLTDGLTASFQVAYTDAFYSSAVTVGTPTISTFINKGDALPTPPVTLDVGISYNIPFLSRYKPYIRGDYQYASSYKRGFGSGTSTYNPYTYTAAETNYVKLRAGIVVKSLEVALFVDNLLDSRDVLGRTGGGVCTNSACTVLRSYNPIFMDTTFRPRTLGLSANYRF